MKYLLTILLIVASFACGQDPDPYTPDYVGHKSIAIGPWWDHGALPRMYGVLDYGDKPQQLPDQLGMLAQATFPTCDPWELLKRPDQIRAYCHKQNACQPTYDVVAPPPGRDFWDCSDYCCQTTWQKYDCKDYWIQDGIRRQQAVDIFGTCDKMIGIDKDCYWREADPSGGPCEITCNKDYWTLEIKSIARSIRTIDAKDSKDSWKFICWGGTIRVPGYAAKNTYFPRVGIRFTWDTLGITKTYYIKRSRTWNDPTAIWITYGCTGGLIVSDEDKFIPDTETWFRFGGDEANPLYMPYPSKVEVLNVFGNARISWNGWGDNDTIRTEYIENIWIGDITPECPL